MKRFLSGLLLLLVVGGAAGWYWQSQIIGVAGRWYMSRMAAREDRSGSLDERREAAGADEPVHADAAARRRPGPRAVRPGDPLSSRVATGEISLNWVAYIYTTYSARHRSQQRPDGKPRRSSEEVARAARRGTSQFYAIQKRPDQRGVKVGRHPGHGRRRDHAGRDRGAERTGKEIDLRNRGAKKRCSRASPGSPVPARSTRASRPTSSARSCSPSARSASAASAER